MARWGAYLLGSGGALIGAAQVGFHVAPLVARASSGVDRAVAACFLGAGAAALAGAAGLLAHRRVPHRRVVPLQAVAAIGQLAVIAAAAIVYATEGPFGGDTDGRAKLAAIGMGATGVLLALSWAASLVYARGRLGAACVR